MLTSVSSQDGSGESETVPQISAVSRYQSQSDGRLVGNRQTVQHPTAITAFAGSKWQTGIHTDFVCEATAWSPWPLGVSWC
jgi:hypothetical protein